MHMTGSAQKLLRDALSLPLEDRAAVAAELLASLDGPLEQAADVEAAWAAEIEKRARGVLTGQASGQTWSEAYSEIEASLPNKP